MRLPLFFLLTFATPLALFALDPPSRRGGIFGFGKSSGSQISSDLFPTQGNSGSTTVPSAPEQKNIFRGGHPKKVKPSSYVIENGQKLEKALPSSQPSSVAPEPVSEAISSTETAATKRGFSWLPFGKKDADAESSKEVEAPKTVETVPAPLIQATPLKADTTKALPVKSPPVSRPAPPAQHAVPLATQSPVEANDQKKGGLLSWLPFIGRKGDDAPDAPIVPTAPLIATPIAATTAPAAKPTPRTESTVTKKPEPKTEKPASSDVAVFEIRRDPNAPVVEEKPTKSASESTFPSPRSIIRFPKKEVDLTGAETIIQNGEIVNESNPAVASAFESKASTGPRQAPQVVNGVKTYSSWKDVDARPASVADRILNQIR